VKVLLHTSSYTCDILEPNDAVFLGAFAKFRKATISCVTWVCLSVCVSVCRERLASKWMTFMQFYTWVFFENRSRKFKLDSNLPKITVLHMSTCIHSWYHLAKFFVERKMFQTITVEKITTRILCSITIFPENRAVYEIMWENMVQPDRPRVTI